MRRASKFNAQPTVEGGIRFASKAEARRYADLRLLEAAGEIKLLVTHPRYALIVKGEKVGTYVADFEYTENGALVVEDIKSKPTMTPIYRLKRKLMLALYDIEIKEVMV